MSDANLERMGEALYHLSDSLRSTGFLTDQESIHNDRYNEVVRAWHGLARAYERLLASVDTRPKDEDAVQQAASLASGEVPSDSEGDAHAC